MLCTLTFHNGSSSWNAAGLLVLPLGDCLVVLSRRPDLRPERCRHCGCQRKCRVQLIRPRYPIYANTGDRLRIVFMKCVVRRSNNRVPLRRDDCARKKWSSASSADSKIRITKNRQVRNQKQSTFYGSSKNRRLSRMHGRCGSLCYRQCTATVVRRYRVGCCTAISPAGCVLWHVRTTEATSATCTAYIGRSVAGPE